MPKRYLRAFMVVVDPRFIFSEAVYQVLRLNGRFGPSADIRKRQLNGCFRLEPAAQLGELIA